MRRYMEVEVEVGGGEVEVKEVVVEVEDAIGSVDGCLTCCCCCCWLSSNAWLSSIDTRVSIISRVLSSLGKRGAFSLLPRARKHEGNTERCGTPRGKHGAVPPEDILLSPAPTLLSLQRHPRNAPCVVLALGCYAFFVVAASK
jgi:hypothetical protein